MDQREDILGRPRLTPSGNGCGNSAVVDAGDAGAGFLGVEIQGIGAHIGDLATSGVPKYVFDCVRSRGEFADECGRWEVW